MAWFKALMIAVQGYGFKKVLGVLFLASFVYALVELFIIRSSKESKGKKLSAKEIKDFTKQQLGVSVILLIIGVVLLLWS